MKKVFVIATLAVLGGCAVPPTGPAYYGNVATAPANPSEWHVVSVTPVPLGTGARSGAQVQYSSTPITVPAPAYVPQPVYVQPPVYLPQPSYYYPPVTIGLDFVFGRHWHSGHRGGWGHRYRGGHGRR